MEKDQPVAKNSPKLFSKADRPLPDPNRKGAYWNYEMNRWSYCEEDSEEDEVDHEQNVAGAAAAAAVVKPGNAVAAATSGTEDDDYEWEYFYEDVDEKDKKDPPVKPQAKENKEMVAVKPVAAEVKPVQKAEPEKVKTNPRNGWICTTCTLLNEPTRPGCAACTTERPADYQVPPPGPADTIPRDPKAEKQPVKEAPAVVDGAAAAPVNAAKKVSCFSGSCSRTQS